MKLSNFFNLIREEAIREASNPQLTPNDKKVLNYILGETLDEADGNKIISKIINLIDSGKKGLLTAAVVAALTSSAAFNTAYAQAPSNVKEKLSSVIGNKGSDKETMTPGTKAKGSVYSDTFSNNFSSGSYDLNPQSITSKLESLKNFLATHQKGDYTINVTASESQVPNQSGFKVKELAAKRAKVLTQIVQKYLSDNGIKNVNIVPHAVVGDIPWDGSDKNAEKYTKDQYVKMDVLAKAGDPAKVGFTKKGGAAQQEQNYVDTTQVIKGKVILKMSPGWIPDRLVITDKDGNVMSDTGYFVDKVNPAYKNYTYVPEYVANLTKMYMSAPNTLATSNLIKKTFNSFDELKSFLIASTEGIPNDIRTETGGGLKTLEALFNKGQREFVFYDKNPKKGNISHQFEPGQEGFLKVLSPVEKTEYSYHGTQEVDGQIEKIGGNK